MGSFKELYLKLSKLALSVERMENFVGKIANQLDSVDDLASFCNIALKGIYSGFGSKEDFLHLYWVLKFMEGESCPICNTKKKGLFKKKCPVHKNLSLEDYAKSLNFKLHTLRALDRRLAEIEGNWHKSLSADEIMILYDIICTYFLTANFEYIIVTDKIGELVNPYRDGRIKTIEFYKGLINMGEFLLEKYESWSENQYTGNRWEWVTVKLFDFSAIKTSNYIIEKIVKRLPELLATDSLYHKIKVPIRYLYTSADNVWSNPDIQIKENYDVEKLSALDFSFLKGKESNLDKIDDFAKAAKAGCNSTE
ncbi:MAG: hypothetical protein ACTSYF_00120, partial [Promethearchaeota archaeon]